MISGGRLLYLLELTHHFESVPAGLVGVLHTQPQILHTLLVLTVGMPFERHLLFDQTAIEPTGAFTRKKRWQVGHVRCRFFQA